jgi:dipeptidyl aminopeptidase/acylaminoacyl peptidase
LFQPLLNATTLPDNTGELDPLEVASGPANAVVFSADGRRLLFACADKSLVLFDVEAGRDQKRLIGHRASVWCVAFSPDGKLAASGGADNSVRLWEVEAGRERVRLEGHSALVSAVAFAPDGRRALSGGYDHILILWDTTTGQELRQYRGVGSYPNQILFVSDKQVLVAAEKAVRLLDLETAKILRTFQGHNASVVSLVKSADHKLFFTGSDDGVILQWRLDSDQPERKFSAGHAGAVRSLALTPKENWLVSGGGDSTVRVWGVAKGTELNRFTKHEESVLAVLFAEDGQQTITASRDRVVKYWTIPKK